MNGIAGQRRRCSPTDINNLLLLDHVAVPAQAPHGAADLLRRQVGGPIKKRVQATHERLSVLRF